MKSIPVSGKKKTRKMNLFLQRFFSFFKTFPKFIIMRNFPIRKIRIYRNPQSTASFLKVFRLTPKRTYIPVCQKSRRKRLCQIIFQSGFFRFFSTVKFFIPKISLPPGKKSVPSSKPDKEINAQILAPFLAINGEIPSIFP